MENKTRYVAAAALEIAQAMARRLKPFCEQIKIAGSLRRQRATVGDIELLFVPHVSEEPDGLFDRKAVNLAEKEIAAMLADQTLGQRKNIKGSVTWGPLNKLAYHIPSGIPVDLFSTTAERWAVSYVIRTGPTELNIRLIEGARMRGLKLHVYGVLEEIKTGHKIVPQSEEELFERCGQTYLTPQERNRFHK